MNSVGPVIWEAPIVENPNCIPMGTIQEFFVRLKDRILVKCIFLLEKTDLYRRFYVNKLTNPININQQSERDIKAALLLAELIIKMESCVRLILFPRVGKKLINSINDYAKKYSNAQLMNNVFRDTISRLNRY
ncbi:MAG: hypothetical protein EB053_05270 [Chlamydiae bacterium]|nr:hypothetical protein [Chlamydiota bacterium]